MTQKIVEFNEKVERITPLLLKWKDDRFLDQSPLSFSDSMPLLSIQKLPQPRQSWCEWFSGRSSQLEENFVEAESLTL